MAERLGLGPEIRKLKLGESFSKNTNTAFHTFRYDFKPASMDTKKMATVEIGQNNQTTVTVPHVEGSGTAHTIFKGSRKPYTKECVLIIDHSTGEIVLEKLSSNVQLKKTRAEASSKVQPQPGASVEQAQQPSNSKRTSPPQKFSPNPVPRSQSPVQRISPNQTSPKRKSPTNFCQRSPGTQRSPSMPSLISSSHSKSSNTLLPIKDGSMPLLTGSDWGFGEPIGASSEVGILSDSSNDSSSGESGSESSDANHREKETNSRKHPGTGTSESLASTSNSQYSNNSFPSMPRFSQLSEDLHLSESESDSDS